MPRKIEANKIIKRECLLKSLETKELKKGI